MPQTTTACPAAPIQCMPSVLSGTPVGNEQKPSRLAYLPAILAGSAALVAAISTLYVNLRADGVAVPASSAQVAAGVVPQADAPQSPTAPAVPTGPRTLRLRLDRVQVEDDGSVGDTDWSFQVFADEQPLFTVPMPALSDKPGENLARPAEAEQATADVEIPRDRQVSIVAKGWKKRLLPGAPAEVSGEAWLTLGLNKTVVRLSTGKPKGPAFTLYFSATEATPPE